MHFATEISLHSAFSSQFVLTFIADGVIIASGGYLAGCVYTLRYESEAARMGAGGTHLRQRTQVVPAVLLRSEDAAGP